MVDGVSTVSSMIAVGRRPATRRDLGAIGALLALFLGTLALSVVSVPTEAGAAPTKETRKEARKRWSMTRMGRPNMVPEREGTFGRPLTAAAVKKLFGGKTWLWQGGGGYLDPNGSFVAVVGTDAASGTYAEGKWEVNDKGQLCHTEEWRSRSGTSNASTCYTHHAWGGSIYQRKEPGGAWYVFRHAPARNGDPVHNLVQGNRIADQVRQVQTAVASR
jgi:hypothetical protein